MCASKGCHERKNTHTSQIAAIHGDGIDAWTGKRVQLYPEPMRVAIRARPARNGSTEPPSSLNEDED
jgi:hypothetical protein